MRACLKHTLPTAAQGARTDWLVGLGRKRLASPPRLPFDVLCSESGSMFTALRSQHSLRAHAAGHFFLHY